MACMSTTVLLVVIRSSAIALCDGLVPSDPATPNHLQRFRSPDTYVPRAKVTRNDRKTPQTAARHDITQRNHIRYRMTVRRGGHVDGAAV